MRVRDLAPAALLLALSTVPLAAARLAPVAGVPVLVRLGANGLAPLGDPALSGIALVALPAPGLAVLSGDLALIRSAFGPGLAWKEKTPCSPSS